MKSVITACFWHNSCCLSYVGSLASSETVPQCTGHASFLTLIFHINISMHLRCGGMFNNMFIAVNVFFYKSAESCCHSCCHKISLLPVFYKNFINNYGLNVSNSYLTNKSHSVCWIMHLLVLFFKYI